MNSIYLPKLRIICNKNLVISMFYQNIGATSRGAHVVRIQYKSDIKNNRSGLLPAIAHRRL